MPVRILCSLLMAVLMHTACMAKEDLGRESSSTSSTELTVLMHTYYLEKNSDQLIESLKRPDTVELLEERERTKYLLAAFLAATFTESPAVATSVAKSHPFEGRLKEAVQRGLWVSGNSKMIAEVFGETPEFAQKEPERLLQMPLTQPGQLDMLWAAFMGTGDTKYVNRIVDVIDEGYELSGDKTADGAMRGSAVWSLTSNMRQHELVRRLIVKEARSRPDPVKQKLEKMLTKIPSVNLGSKEGDFTGQLLVLNEAQKAEFLKPEDQTLILKTRSKAKRGETLLLKIMFAGQELTEDLKADVRFDLKILDPDGKVYDKADFKDLEGVVGRVPNRFTFFDNREAIGIRFEPQDKVGSYLISAMVRDNVANKSLRLEQRVELTD